MPVYRIPHSLPHTDNCSINELPAMLKEHDTVTTESIVTK